MPRSFQRRSCNMRRILIAVVCFCSLCFTRPAHAGWREVISPSRNWTRIKNCCSATSRRVAGYCHEKVEHAKADQAKTWGLKLPANFDPDKPLIVLIHGLDSHSGVWWSMGRMLEAEHYQVGYFGFPSDGPIQDDADRFATEMAALHERRRRAGVKYTIVMGDHHVLSRVGEGAMGTMAPCLPKRVWGVRLCRAGLERAEARLAQQKCDSDGVVPLASAKLPGVDD